MKNQVVAAFVVFLLTCSARASDNCSNLLTLELPHAKITSAQEMAPGSFQEPGENPRHHNYADLPGFCRVHGVSTPTPDSQIGFEVWLPLANWSGRLHMVGNGAYGSDIYWAQIGERIRQNDVGVATDTGHDGSDLTFGIGHPERIADWGHRAVHESVAAAKLVVQAYLRKPPRYSYFSGCSTGGAQALSEAQNYPDDFDGIIAGDPGNNRASLNMAFLWQFLKNHHYGDNSHPILDIDDLKFVNKAVKRACDSQDGVEDGVINDPRVCKFDIETLRCIAGATGRCLSDDKLSALREMYAGPHDNETGIPIFPGYTFGSEAVEARPDEPLPGWSAYWNNPRKPQEPQRADFFRHWVFNDPNWDWWSFSWHTDPAIVKQRVSPQVDATNPDLLPFAAKGGKLIMFMGWDDPVGSSLSAIQYYKQVEEFTANHPHSRDVKTFARLYMIPGMAHCAGGPGATNFSTATRDSSPPKRDSRHDMAIALEDWVENHRPPETLIGTHYGEDGKSVAFQRPICVFPKVARYRGRDVSKAESFRCED